MSFTVNSSTNSGPSTAGLARSQQAIEQSLRRLATGKRINSAADDAAGLAVAQELLGSEQSYSVAGRNAIQGTSKLQIADGALAGQEEGLLRLRELTVQSANDTLSDADRQAIQTEANGVVSELDRTAKETEYNGAPLLTGQNTSDFQVGTGSGPESRVSVTINASTSNALGVSGLDLSTQGAATGSLDSIDAAIASVSQNRAGIGAAVGRLKSAYATAQTSFENAARGRSAIEDTDTAAEASDLALNNIARQAGVAVQAQSQQSRSSVLRLLG